MGAFQTPTLRNVAKVPYEGFTKAYGHNGYFTTLESFVHFYNTRDVLPQCPPGISRVGETGFGQTVGQTCWPAPEQPATMNTTLMGTLGLTDEEEFDLVAFMRTLTDDIQ